MIFLDLYVLALMLLPPQDRQQWVIDIVNVSTFSITNVQSGVQSFFEEKEYELQFNGQVNSLEHLLNDLFDPNDRLIEIDDPVLISPTYVFNDSEGNESTYLTNTSEAVDGVYMFNESELAGQSDFIIKIPASVTYDAEILTIYVNKYRIAPMRWTIEII